MQSHRILVKCCWTVGALVFVFFLSFFLCRQLSVNYWLSRLEAQQKSPVLRWADLGPKAVPSLLQIVRNEDSFATRVYRRAWANLPVLAQRWLPAPAPVYPNAISDVGEALSALGPPALSKMITCLNDRDRSVRRAILIGLQGMASSAEAAIPAILPLMHNYDAQVRYEAVSAINAIGNKKVVAALISMLRDDDQGSGITIGVREHSAELLGQMGPDAQAAVPELRRMLNDAHPLAREQAALALWRIARETNAVSGLVAEFEKAPDPATQERVLTILENMGPSAKDAAPVILAASKYANLAVREHATEFLDQLGVDARSIEPELQELLNDPSSYERCRAAFLLWHVTRRTNIVSVLTRELPQVTDVYSGRRIAAALGEFGPGATVALPALKQVLIGTNTPYGFQLHYNHAGDLVVVDVQAIAAEACGKIGQEGRPAEAELKHMLTDSRPWRRHEAALALWRIDHDTNVVSFFVAELRKLDRRQFEACGLCSRLVSALGEVGNSAKSVAPILADLASDTAWGGAPKAAQTKLRQCVQETLLKINAQPGDLFEIHP